MTILHKLASMQNRRDEVPNVVLALELSSGADANAIGELVANLSGDNKRVQSDCIKVLYEIGKVDAKLISPYVDVFIDALECKSNRVVWGAMTALVSIAPLEAKKIYAKRSKLIDAIDAGSAITVDQGIEALSRVAASNSRYRKELWPYLSEFLRSCCPRGLAMHATSVSQAISASEVEEFSQIIEDRIDEVSRSAASRLKKVVRSVSRKANVG